jgi:hypothetical protein
LEAGKLLSKASRDLKAYISNRTEMLKENGKLTTRIKELSKQNTDVVFSISDFKQEVKILTLQRNQMADNLANAKNKYFNEYDLALRGPRFNYKNMFKRFIKQVDSLFECSITMDELTKPIVLPSGHSISEEFAKQLLKAKRPDPYDRTKIVKHIVVNRLAIDVKEAVNDFKKIQEDLEHQDNFSDQSCQTDFIVRSEQDIEEIKTLKHRLVKMQKFYESKCRMLAMQKSSDALKMLIYFNQTQNSLPMNILILHMWMKYVSKILYILCRKTDRDLTKTYRDFSVQVVHDVRHRS